MTDIVERLRSLLANSAEIDAMLDEAADEIERLRAQVYELEKQIALDSIGWNG